MESSSSSLSKKTGANCQLKQASKRAELNKLYKKVEKVSRRLFHTERNTSTFVPSAQQQSAQSGSSASSLNDANPPPPPHHQYHQMPHQPILVNPAPPYPVHPGFGTGFPPLPAQQHVPPSYGWALNGIESSSIPSSTAAFSALSLDIADGDETSGSGFEHLSIPDEQDYLRPDPHAIEDKKNAQSAKLERVKQRLLDEVTDLNQLLNDETELNRWYEQKFVHILIEDDAMTTDELEETVRQLEEKLRRLRSKSSHGGPPPRPPPPRSVSQESSYGPWSCARCRTENRADCYRCRSCRLPSRRFDPSEVERCGCEYCSMTTTD